MDSADSCLIWEYDGIAKKKGGGGVCQVNMRSQIVPILKQTLRKIQPGSSVLNHHPHLIYSKFYTDRLL